MVYKQKFVAVVKVNGKVLREIDDKIILPFNSSYSILLKNLETRNSLVKIHIDGKDVLNGSSIIIKSNEEVELLGFLKGSKVRNRFKFIQKTKKIQDYRGDKIDDGIIRIEFAFEKLIPESTTIYTYHPPIFGPLTSINNQTSWTTTGGNISSYMNNVGSIPSQDEGITVEGEPVNQDFCYSSIGNLDKAEVIILRMCGTTGDALTTKKKIICKTCGTRSKSRVKYCPECGTCLI